MFFDLGIEFYLSAGYAVLLALIAMFLEWMARHSQQRSERYQTAGFRFHRDQDSWECPEGARLTRSEADYELRVIHYRAPAHTCNGCAIKQNCTDSDQGRKLSVSVDPWVRSATGRFQRGMSLVLLSLAALILSVEIARTSWWRAQMLLGSLLAFNVLLILHLFSRLRDQQHDAAMLTQR